MYRWATAVLIPLLSLSSLAADSGHDFSGKWLFEADQSDMRGLKGEIYPVVEVDLKGGVHCVATTSAGGTVEWTYKLNGDDAKFKAGEESWNSAVKWEGAALLVNSLVSGPADYTVMDRWMLSQDGYELRIQRQEIRAGKQSEGFLVYRREGAPGTKPQPATTLTHRPEAPPAAPPTRFLVPKGTHILLSLTNPLSTKNSKDGDHVYLQTAVPVAESDRIVIPRGSYVQASVSKTKAAGRGANKGELYILFDSITLPNGVTRDFHARLTSTDADANVDKDEGKISGSGKGDTPGQVARDAGIGAAGGVLVGGLAGHPIAGAGAGAVAGVAAVLLSKNKDVILPRGTSVEMVLDRDISYSAVELGH